MKTYTVLVVMMLFVSGIVFAFGGGVDSGDQPLASIETSGEESNDAETTESRFTPQPEQEFQIVVTRAALCQFHLALGVQSRQEYGAFHRGAGAANPVLPPP